MDSAALFQRTVKENTDDLHAFLEDIKSWEDEIKKKDELLSKQKPILKKTLPPVRNKSTKNKQDKMKSGKSTETRKSARINSYDYHAWDKFDVEQACEDNDEGASESSSEHEEEDDENESEEFAQEQNQQKAVIEKEKGNLLFSQHKYEAAIERYTQAIALDPTNAVLPANRAMALLKMDRFAAAEQDCTIALSIDPTYTKALFRRATARMKLNKLQDAACDFNELLKYEPENKKAKAELVRISSMKTNEISKNKKEQQQQLQGDQQGLVFPITRPSYMRSKKPLKTVVIEEIGSGASPAVGKGPPPTLKTVIKDDTLSMPAGSAVTTTSKSTVVEGLPVTAEDMVNDVTNTVKDLPAKIKDNHTAVKGKSNTVRNPPATKQDTPVNPSVAKPELPPVPSSSIAFLHDWKRLQAHGDLKSQYFQLLSVDKYSTILSQCLETDVFPDIINILYNSYVKCGRPCIKELQALTRVQRFSMAVMFLSSRDKSTLHEIFSKLKSLATDDDKRVLQQLAKIYKVSL